MLGFLPTLNFIADVAAWCVVFQLMVILMMFVPVSIRLLWFVHKNITTDLIGFMVELSRSDADDRTEWMTLNLPPVLSALCVIADGFCGTMWKFVTFFSVVFCFDYFILIPIAERFF